MDHPPDDEPPNPDRGGNGGEATREAMPQASRSGAHDPAAVGAQAGGEASEEASADLVRVAARSYISEKCCEVAEDDFTFYLLRNPCRPVPAALAARATAGGDWFKAYCDGKAPSAKRKAGKPPVTSYDIEEQFEVKGIVSTVRLQVSSTDKGRAWSVTARVNWGKGAKPRDKREPAKRESPLATKWAPPDKYLFAEDTDKTDAERVAPAKLFSIAESVNVLFEALFHEQIKQGSATAQGLLLVTGSTGSTKSNVSRGLIHAYLGHCAGISAGGRNLHVLTHEDPIEAALFPKPASDDEAAMLSQYSQQGIDYTSRQAGVDTAGLKETVNAALRQKPAVLYVGEVRDARDLRTCLEFGGTGHLVVATAHAGSLIESVEKVLVSVDAAGEPGKRAIWVPKIFGVVHLAPLECRFSADFLDDRPADAGGAGRSDLQSLQGIVPAVYRATAQGRQGLVADGLVSLVPHCPRHGSSAVGSLGRQYFVRELCRGPITAADRFKKGSSLPERWARLRQWNSGQSAAPGEHACFPAAGVRLVDTAHDGDLDGR